jgi:hypothetical protein
MLLADPTHMTLSTRSWFVHVAKSILLVFNLDATGEREEWGFDRGRLRYAERGRWDDDKRGGALPAGTEDDCGDVRRDLHVGASAKGTSNAIRARLNAPQQTVQRVQLSHAQANEQGRCRCMRQRR